MFLADRIEIDFYLHGLKGWFAQFSVVIFYGVEIVQKTCGIFELQKLEVGLHHDFGAIKSRKNLGPFLLNGHDQAG